MKTVEWARWATEKEKETLKYFQQKNEKDKEATFKFLSENKNHIIEKYADYVESKLNSYEQKKNEYRDKIIMDRQKLEYEISDLYNQYEFIKMGEKIKCSCGKGYYKEVQYNGSTFIGCSNYMDKTVNHDNNKFRKIGYELPKLSEELIESMMHFNIFGKNYISEFKSYAAFPKYIKVSILFEWLIANDQEIHNEDLKRDYYQTVVNNNRTAKIQEKICEDILKTKFDKLLVQPHLCIKYSFKGKEAIRIPDFIGINGDTIYVFDLKKSIYNEDMIKLNDYKEAIEYMVNSKKLNKTIKAMHIYYDKEESEFSSHDINSLQIQEIGDYEFN